MKNAKLLRSFLAKGLLDRLLPNVSTSNLRAYSVIYFVVYFVTHFTIYPSTYLWADVSVTESPESKDGIYFRQVTNLPLVDLWWAVDTGFLDDPSDLSGLHEILATALHSSPMFRDFETLGASIDTRLDEHLFIIRLHGMSKHFGQFAKFFDGFLKFDSNVISPKMFEDSKLDSLFSPVNESDPSSHSLAIAFAKISGMKDRLFVNPDFKKISIDHVRKLYSGMGKLKQRFFVLGSIEESELSKLPKLDTSIEDRRLTCDSGKGIRSGTDKPKAIWVKAGTSKTVAMRGGVIFDLSGPSTLHDRLVLTVAQTIWGMFPFSELNLKLRDASGAVFSIESDVSFSACGRTMLSVDALAPEQDPFLVPDGIERSFYEFAKKGISERQLDLATTYLKGLSLKARDDREFELQEKVNLQFSRSNPNVYQLIGDTKNLTLADINQTLLQKFVPKNNEPRKFSWAFVSKDDEISDKLKSRNLNIVTPGELITK